MEPSIPIMLRLPPALAERADKAAEVLQQRNPGMRVTRADVLRRALIEFADRLDAEDTKKRR